MIEFHVNNEPASFDGDEDTPLLWILRDHLALTGTKFGCGIGSCGACTVHIDGRASKACTRKASSIAGKRITTIEGLASPSGQLHPLQQAWIDDIVMGWVVGIGKLAWVVVHHPQAAYASL